MSVPDEDYFERDEGYYERFDVPDEGYYERT